MRPYGSMVVDRTERDGGRRGARRRRANGALALVSVLGTCADAALQCRAAGLEGGASVQRSTPAQSFEQVPRGYTPRLCLCGGSDLVKVKLQVRVDHAKPGDSVVLNWSSSNALRRRSAFEAWDSSRGVEMNYIYNEDTDTLDPFWWAEVALPVADTVWFNFAVRSPSGITTPEPGGRREIVIPDEASAVLSFEFGNTGAGAVHVAPRASGWPACVSGLIAASRAAVEQHRRLPQMVEAVLMRLDAFLHSALSRILHSPALLAHLPLAALLVWDMLKPHPLHTIRVREGVHASITRHDRREDAD